ISEENRLTKAERSAYFARREAAKVLRKVLQGDARRRASGSIKSLVYSPTVRNKKATFALVCQTLKYLPVIQNVMKEAKVLNSISKKPKELMYIIAYDLLFGQESLLKGDAENILLQKKKAINSALSRILIHKGVNEVDDLLSFPKIPREQKPRYVRVNTLSIDSESAIRELSKKYEVLRDELVTDLLILPPGTDLHNHPLVINGSLFLQGKASSMAAVALSPRPGWDIIDACAAPGNKTLHLAALVKGKGRIIACERNQERCKLLKHNVELAGATNVEVNHVDFLSLDPLDSSYSRVRAILVDPSCSGSGTASDRLDHLLPSSHGSSSNSERARLQKLMFFQKKALLHALAFPAVERIVYSTCSVHRAENEDVVSFVLDFASSRGFRLATAIPKWPRRGFPSFRGARRLLRTDPAVDREGFFIALFVRK
ncbi:hypothetical protein M569_04929, partial [Genlisea aurea]